MKDHDLPGIASGALDSGLMAIERLIELEEMEDGCQRGDAALCGADTCQEIGCIHWKRADILAAQREINTHKSEPKTNG